jgi:hypothetical protein
MAFHHSPRIVTDQLVFSWDIPNKKSYPGSGATITNLISDAENLTINNATIQSGSSNGNGSVVMDGSGDYLSFADTTFSNTMSFSIWHKARISDPSSSDPYAYGYLFSKNGGTNFGIAFSEGGTSGAISPGMYYFYNGSSSTAISTAVAQNNVWGNIVVVFNKTANEIKFYFNGVLNQTSSVTLSSVDMVFNQFGRYTNSNWYLIGELAACYIYNKELSASEVLNNYNALKGRFV